MTRLIFRTLTVLLLSASLASAQTLIVTGEFDAGTDTLQYIVPTGSVSFSVEVSGTFSGSLQVVTTTRGNTPDKVIQLVNTATGLLTDVITGTGIYTFNNTGMVLVRVQPVGAAWTSGTAVVRVTRGYGPVVATSDVEFGGSLTVGAQPANDPHFVRCSNSTVASPCLIAFGTFNRSDTFTAAGNGTSLQAGSTLKFYSLQVTATGGTPTAWNVSLQVSLDGTTWANLITHISTSDTLNSIVAQATPFPALYIRSVTNSITLGPATNIVVNILGTP